MTWLISLVPWWAWLLLAAALVGAVWQVWGWQGALAAAGAALAVLSYGKGRAEGSASEQAKQEKADADAVVVIRRERQEVDDLTETQLDKEFERWNRK